MKNDIYQPISCFSLKTVHDTAIVTMEDEWELLVCDLLNGAISSGLQ